MRGVASESYVLRVRGTPAKHFAETLKRAPWKRTSTKQDCTSCFVLWKTEGLLFMFARQKFVECLNDTRKTKSQIDFSLPMSVNWKLLIPSSTASNHHISNKDSLCARWYSHCSEDVVGKGRSLNWFKSRRGLLVNTRSVQFSFTTTVNVTSRKHSASPLHTSKCHTDFISSSITLLTLALPPNCPWSLK